MTTRTFAGGGPFAHLDSRRKAAAATTTSDEDDDAKKAKKKAKAEDGGDTTDPQDNEDRKKDKIDDVADDAQNDDDVTEDDDAARKARKSKAKKAGRAKADEDSDDDDADMKASAIRKRERARCEQIFLSEHAAGRPSVAAHLAFRTGMSAENAIGVLAATASSEQEPRQGSGLSLRTRMEQVHQSELGDDAERKPEKTGPQAFAAAVIQADKIRRGLA